MSSKPTNPNTDRDERVSVAPERIWINSGAWWSKTPYPTGSVEYIRADTAATRMRDRCVKKVKSMRDEWREKHADASSLETWRHFGTLFNGADEIIKELQSLTLEGEQEK